MTMGAANGHAHAWVEAAPDMRVRLTGRTKSLTARLQLHLRDRR